MRAALLGPLCRLYLPRRATPLWKTDADFAVAAAFFTLALDAAPTARILSFLTACLAALIERC